MLLISAVKPATPSPSKNCLHRRQSRNGSNQYQEHIKCLDCQKLMFLHHYKCDQTELSKTTVGLTNGVPPPQLPPTRLQTSVPVFNSELQLDESLPDLVPQPPSLPPSDSSTSEDLDPPEKAQERRCLVQ